MSRVYETAIKIGASISKAFKGDTYNAAAALTKLGKATKDLKAAEKSAAAFKKLDGEMARGKARYDTATAALRKLEEAERAAGGATKESTKWRKAGAREVASAARQLDRATKGLQKHAEVLHKLGVDTSKLTSEQERLTRALAATERQEKALGRYEASRERLFGARKKTPLMEKAGGQIRGLASEAMMLGTAAAGAAVGLYELVSKTAEGGDQAAKMAKRLGIGVEALQELRYAGERSGATIEDVDTALGKMAINIGKHKIAKGKGAGVLAIPGLQSLKTDTESTGAAEADPFKHIGLSAKKLALLKPDEQVVKIAEAMRKLKTDADRSAVAVAIFGRGGLSMVPALAGDLAKLRAEARATGGVLSKEATEKAEQFKDAQIDARLAAAGLINTLGVGLLPVATETFKQFSAWAKKQDFQKRAKEISAWIESKGIPALKKITGEVVSFGSKVLWLVEGAAKLTGGFGNLAIVVAGLRIAPLAFTFGKIGIEATKAAIAVFKYVAAKRAAAAAGAGFEGMGPAAAGATGKAIGIAANASMLLGAASIGYAIGSYLDEKFDLSGSLEKAGHILTTKDDDLNEGDRAAKHSAWSIVKGTLFGGGAGGVQAAVEAQAEFMKKKAAELAKPHTGGGAGAHFAPVFHIGGGLTREHVAKGMDTAKKKALDEFDKREAHRKRVAYAG